MDMTGIPKREVPRTREAKQFEVRIAVANLGECVIEQQDGGRFMAQSLRFEVVSGGQSTSTPVDIDFQVWRMMSVDDRARLLESYVHEVLRDSGFLDVVAGTKV